MCKRICRQALLTLEEAVSGERRQAQSSHAACMVLREPQASTSRDKLNTHAGSKEASFTQHPLPCWSSPRNTSLLL